MNPYQRSLEKSGAPHSSLRSSLSAVFEKNTLRVHNKINRMQPAASAMGGRWQQTKFIATASDWERLMRARAMMLCERTFVLLFYMSLFFKWGDTACAAHCGTCMLEIIALSEMRVCPLTLLCVNGFDVMWAALQFNKQALLTFVVRAE